MKLADAEEGVAPGTDKLFTELIRKPVVSVSIVHWEDSVLSMVSKHFDKLSILRYLDAVRNKAVQLLDRKRVDTNA